MNYKRPNILIIAGSDSGGCAGIQTDIKVCQHLDAHACTAITAITAQNTKGVDAIYPLSFKAIQTQLTSISSDIQIDAIKIGMLFNQEIIDAVSNFCHEYCHLPIVIDPVCVATSGDRLLEPSAIKSLIKKLLPYACLITPNFEEYQTLLSYGFNKDSHNHLITGGDSNNDTVYDRLFLKDRKKLIEFQHAKIQTKNTHGSGCSLSTAIAINLANGFPITISVKKAIDTIYLAIKKGRDYFIGHGCGPLKF